MMTLSFVPPTTVLQLHMEKLVFLLWFRTRASGGQPPIHYQPHLSPTCPWFRSNHELLVDCKPGVIIKNVITYTKYRKLIRYHEKNNQVFCGSVFNHALLSADCPQ